MTRLHTGIRHPGRAPCGCHRLCNRHGGAGVQTAGNKKARRPLCPGVKGVRGATWACGRPLAQRMRWQGAGPASVLPAVPGARGCVALVAMQVLCEVITLSKAFAAQGPGAGIRLFTAVAAQMGLQGGVLREGFCTAFEDTGIGSASGMDTLVCPQGGALGEGLSTVFPGADKGSVARMDTLVFPQGRRLCKSLPARIVATDKGFSSHMCAQVSLQVLLVRKALLAVVPEAGEGAGTGVGVPVALQSEFLGESLCAALKGTDKRTLSGMQPQVPCHL